MFTLETKMSSVLKKYPYIKKALHQKFHVGGCAKCDFEEEDSISEVAIKKGVEPNEFLNFILGEEGEKLEITPLEFKKLLELPDSCTPVIVDVRQKWEFDLVHLPNSVLLESYKAIEDFLALYRDRTLVTLCHHGVRSLHAAYFFKEQGIKNVYSLQGGIDQYAQEIDTTLQKY